MAKGVDTLARHALPKKGNLKRRRNYRTISLTNHPCKIMLRVILNWLKAKAEELRAEEKAGFRPGRSTAEQIFNSRVIIEKHLQHQRGMFQNSIDVKKMFYRVWHPGPWHVVRNFNIDKWLVQAIQALCGNSSSAVLLNSQLWEFLKTTVRVRQGYLLSPILFNLNLEKIMQETLHEYHTPIAISGRLMCNLRFADESILWMASTVNFKISQSNGMCNGSQQRKEQDHDQQHEQHQWRY